MHIPKTENFIIATLFNHFGDHVAFGGHYRIKGMSRTESKWSTAGIKSERIQGQVTRVQSPRGGSFTSVTIKADDGRTIDVSFPPFTGIAPGTNVVFDHVPDGRMRTGGRAKNINVF